MKKFLIDVFHLVRKDFRIEQKTHELLTVMLAFAISVLFILNFALDRNIKSQTDGAAGLIWIILILSGQLGINQAMNIEKGNHMLEALFAAPISRTSVYFSKTIVVFLSMLIMSLIIFPLYFVFYNYQPGNLQFIWICLLGCWGYASAGVLISTMTMQSRTRDILLPVLFFPLIIPLVISSIKATGISFSGESINLTNYWVAQLIAFDIIFTVLGALGFDIIATE